MESKTFNVKDQVHSSLLHLQTPKQKFLTPLHGEPKTKPVIGFDVETYGPKNKFVLGAVSYPHETVIYDDPELMLAELGHSRNKDYLIYATNLSFDAFVLFQEVAGPRGIPEGWSAFDNGAKLIWCKRQIEDTDTSAQNRFVTLLDSMNLFPMGVYNLGNILGKVSKTYRRNGDITAADYFSVGKLIAPACMGKKKLSSLTDEEYRDLSTYCAADASVTRKFMEWANQEIVRLGAKVKITAASTAMDLFRRRYLNQTIPQPHYECLIESRFSYYGGRTEDYFKGNVGEAHEQDVTAMYPDAMARIEFPYPSPENFTKVLKPSDHIFDYEGFAKATITVPTHLHYPPLPFKANSHLLFPVGSLDGIWTHLQIRHAIELGCEVSNISWSYYNTHTFNPFKDYVNSLIKLRLQYLCPGCEYSDSTGRKCWEDGRKCPNSDAIEEVIKLFLNGLYGKFAQNFLTDEEAEKYKLYAKKGGGTFKPIAEANSEELTYTMMNFPEYFAQGIVINKAVPSLKAFMNPILAAYITSAAQCKVNSLQWKAHSYDIPVFYTDTDSLYTKKRLPFATISKALGELQYVGKSDELIIVGPKAKLTRNHSSNSSKPTFKGIPSKSFIIEDGIQKETAPKADIFKAMELDKLEVTYTRFTKYRESMIRGLSTNEMTQMTKEFKPFENPKRQILGKPTIKKLLTHSYPSIPWKINPKTQEVEAQ